MEELMPRAVGCEREQQRTSLSQKLEIEERRLEERLAEIKQARKALDTNPQIKEVIDLLTKLNLHY